MVDITGMAIATFTSSIMTCVTSRSKYNKGVHVDTSENHDKSSRTSSRSVLHVLGSLFRGNKNVTQEANQSNRSSSSSLSTAIEQRGQMFSVNSAQGGHQGHRTLRPHPMYPRQGDEYFSVNSAEGGPIPQGPRARTRHRIRYHPLPQDPLPCLGYKYGAPDGIDRRDVEDIFEPRSASWRETESYGDTYVLPAPESLD
ncbi:hypothetical protein Q1695_015364 [Nippostrongylus brasiliensis]|nr:hypothetical protein Q1695_015364 [Nippostrongylus brasiliensis]